MTRAWHARDEATPREPSIRSTWSSVALVDARRTMSLGGAILWGVRGPEIVWNPLNSQVGPLDSPLLFLPITQSVFSPAAGLRPSQQARRLMAPVGEKR